MRASLLLAPSRQSLLTFFVFLSFVVSVIQPLTGDLASSSRTQATLKIRPLRQLPMLPNFLFALAHTTHDLCHQGLECLALIVRPKEHTRAKG